MPKDGVDPDDPWEIVCVALPSLPGYDSLDEMARCFIEEFALMGWSADRILRLFRNPFYAGVNSVYRQRGEEYVRALIAQTLGTPAEKEERHG